MNRSLLAEAVAELSGHLCFRRLLGLKAIALSPAAREALERLNEASSSPGLDRAAALAGLAAQAEGCRRCSLAGSRTRVVFGEGSAEAEVMFVGEGPGQEEDLSGRPFVGEAGGLLTRIIKAMGFERDGVYIANVVKCRPPRNRDPKPEEAAACWPWLQAQLELIKPRVIVALGAVAAQRLLKTEARIGQLRGRFHDMDGLAVMPTYHPSYILRRGEPRELRAKVWSDVKQVLDLLGRKPPRS